jgi:predicted metal-dependent peptidase
MSEARLDKQRIAAARLWAAMQFPYLASAVFASPVVAAPGLGSIAVDRSWRLYMDPDLVGRWSAEEIGSVLVHHAGHLLRDHAARAQQLGIDESTELAWVAAADAEINDDLVDADVSFPVDPIVPTALECEPGGFAEDYFRRIRDRKEFCPGECGSGAHGRARRWERNADGIPQISRASAHLLRCKVASEIRRCCGQLPGTVPQGWQRWADELLEPKVDWRHALSAEVRAGFASVAGCVDYSYTRPSRRASVTGSVILPAMRKPLPTVAVVIDTSGSMTGDLLGEALAEVQGILRGLGLDRDRISVLSCDAQAHRAQRVSSARQVQLVGGGGTNMGAGIEAALESRPRPSVVVVLTDGYTPWPARGPKRARVVVGLVGPGRWPVPQWARLVRIEDVAHGA